MSKECGQRYDASLPYPGDFQDPPSLPSAVSSEKLPIQTSRKRKHFELGDRCQLGQAFSIRPHSSLPSLKAQQLIPRLLLPRACLPLAYLDPTGDAEDQVGSRLFAARVEILEDVEKEDQQPRVLIADSVVDGRLHAIERVQIGLYALCKLCAWVDLYALEGLNALLVKHGPQKRKAVQGQSTMSQGEWWRPAATSLDIVDKSNEGSIPGITKPLGARLCLQRPVQDDRPPSPAIPEVIRPITPKPVEYLLDGSMEQPPQEPEDIYSMIRLQYQEALYASKASLAYFAKGPLSRARAAINSRHATAHSHSELVQYLRTNILVLATMDIKYRETLPSLVKDLPFGTLSEDECEPVVVAMSKKIRKSKKPKVGKNGLYPGEELNIARWWLSREQSSMACDTAATREEATRAVLLEQRAKETQMQIIMVLETLALEASAPAWSVEQDPPQEPVQADQGSQKKSRKRKKQQDLTTLLDLLADRLSIWQSMSVDEGNTAQKEQQPTSQNGAKATNTATDNDQLRQFCVDVLLPFYAARLPDLTALLCQKLGGPKQPSPRRPPLAKAVTSSASIVPGAAVQRVQPRKPRRTLERVLTDERSASRRPSSLSRSATEPALPKLKREVSDVSLSSIPFNMVAMHKRYSQREVDLNVASQATEAKLKKKAKVDQELHSAIAALKKPNPRMAVKELVEDAAKRAERPQSKKNKNPIRNPLAQGVQIMATPSNNRHKDVFAGLPRLPRSSAAQPSVLEEVPPSSISRITDSARKPPGASGLLRDSSRTKRILSNVQQTPTRGPLKFLSGPRTSSGSIPAEKIARPLHFTPGHQPATTVAGPGVSYSEGSWPSTAHKTPATNRPFCQPDQAEALGIEVTPVKLPPIALTFESPREPPPHLAPETSMSIYASLGWDDEVDELS